MDIRKYKKRSGEFIDSTYTSEWLDKLVENCEETVWIVEGNKGKRAILAHTKTAAKKVYEGR